MSMPNIKGETNRQSEQDKTKPGFLARLFGGAARDSAGFSNGWGGAAAGGGLLATKTGLLALILAGTTVAGGVGVIGYRLFGPGQDRIAGENLQLFAPRPKTVPAPDVPPVAKDGKSSSLENFAKANAAPAGPETAPSTALQDANAGTSVNAPATGGAVRADASGAATSTDNGVNKLLKNSTHFKPFSTGSEGGTGGAPMASAAPVKVAGGASDATSTARVGATSGLKRGLAFAGGTSRALAGRSFGSGAVGQAFGVRSDNIGARSSYSAGRTYDSASAAVGNNISGGTPIGGDLGAGGGGAAQPKSMTNPALNTRAIKPPPTPPATSAAPWQNAINTAEVLVGLALLLMIAAQYVPPFPPLARQIMGAIIALIGLMVITLGSQIASGPYAQTLQGGVLAAAGVGLMIAGAMTAASGRAQKTGNPNTSAADHTTFDKSGKEIFQAPKGLAGLASSAGMFVMLGGGVALLGLAATMMMPPQKYPSTTFQNGNPPDTHWFG